MKTILFICGSLREKSLNRQVGEQARTLLEEKTGNQISTEWLDYADLPLMNQDDEFPAPAAVARIREKAQAADAIWIFSPEYNKNIPGVLKNCLDWLSRPLEPGGKVNAVSDKLVTFTCAGGGFEGRYCAAALADLLPFIGMDTILSAHTAIGLTREAFTTDVLHLTSEERIALSAQAQILLERIAAK